MHAGVEKFVLYVRVLTILQGFNVAAPMVQRTIIRSAARLTFESAQRLIDRADTVDIDSSYLPKPEPYGATGRGQSFFERSFFLLASSSTKIIMLCFFLLYL